MIIRVVTKATSWVVISVFKKRQLLVVIRLVTKRQFWVVISVVKKRQCFVVISLVTKFLWLLG